MSKFFKNSLIASFLWGIFNFILVIIAFMLNSYAVENIYFDFSSQKMMQDFYTKAFWVLVPIIIIALMGFFAVGRYKLNNTKNALLDLLSLITFHAPILLCVLLICFSEHTMIFLINSFCAIIERTFNVKYDLYNSFEINAAVSLVPYLFMFLGLISKNLIPLRSKKKNN